MPNQPKTPISSFRFTAETQERLSNLAEMISATKTEAAVRAIEAFSVALHQEANDAHVRAGAPRPEGPTMCPLGYGHTTHIWEYVKGATRHVWLCAGQPFTNGYDALSSN